MLSRAQPSCVRAVQEVATAAAHAFAVLPCQANSTFASSEGYTLEGTKKTGASKKKLAAVLANVKKESAELAAKK
jgi:hypothetical protein